MGRHLYDDLEAGRPHGRFAVVVDDATMDLRDGVLRVRGLRIVEGRATAEFLVAAIANALLPLGLEYREAREFTGREISSPGL